MNTMHRSFKGLVAIALISIMLVGCAMPTPEQDLNAAVAALDIVSALPNLTATDRAWITAAASGLSCSSAALAKGEPAAQEAIDIAACLAKLPAIPTGDQPYISAGIAAVELFISLFAPNISPAAMAANAKVRKMKPEDRAKFLKVSGIREKTDFIRAKVTK